MFSSPRVVKKRPHFFDAMAKNGGKTCSKLSSILRFSSCQLETPEISVEVEGQVFFFVSKVRRFVVQVE